MELIGNVMSEGLRGTVGASIRVRVRVRVGADTGRGLPVPGGSSSGSSNGGGVRRDCVSGCFVDVRTDALGVVFLLSLSLSTCLSFSFSSPAMAPRDK